MVGMGTFWELLLWIRHIFCLLQSSPGEMSSSIIPILQMIKKRLREVNEFKHITHPVSGRGSIRAYRHLINGAQGRQPPRLQPEWLRIYRAYLFDILGCLTKLCPTTCALEGQVSPICLLYRHRGMGHPRWAWASFRPRAEVTGIPRKLLLCPSSVPGPAVFC